MKFALLIAASTLLLGSAAQSQVNPGNLKWGPAPPFLPRGAQAAVLAGDPGRPGQFTIRLRFPPGYAVAPHTHPADEHVTVISGQLSLGMGQRVRPRRMATLVAGGFANAGAGMAHYVSTRSGAIVQVTSQGPFAVNYVNPADDPRRHR
ncbi:MAG: cupin domain-containing protein [Sphingomicrobium sp.]